MATYIRQRFPRTCYKLKQARRSSLPGYFLVPVQFDLGLLGAELISTVRRAFLVPLGIVGVLTDEIGRAKSVRAVPHCVFRSGHRRIVPRTNFCAIN
jgi:hypothetical protein